MSVSCPLARTAARRAREERERISGAGFVSDFASKLKKAGISRSGRMSYELANGSTVEYDFALAVIEFMGELTAGRIVFGPDDCEPLLGVTALESVGFTVDPANRQLKRLPAIPLK